MSKRKIVGIAFDTFGTTASDSDGEVESQLNVLDDHGDVFRLDKNNRGDEWVQVKLPALPDKEGK